MLSAEQRRRLEVFVKRTRPGTPYLRRAQILLLDDSGLSPEAIASRVGVTPGQARHLLRAFNRQGLKLFPDWVVRETAPYTADDGMDAAARAIFVDQLQRIDAYEPVLTAALHGDGTQDEEMATGVHEMRKALRRLRTGLRLFAPYLAEDAFQPYANCFKQAMRRLARSRDLTVFNLKLQTYVEQVTDPAVRDALVELGSFWHEQQVEADGQVALAIREEGFQACLGSFRRLVETTDERVGDRQEDIHPYKVRHLAPVRIYEQLAAVRAYGDNLNQISLSQLHKLRIQFKALRYSLEFFAPVLGHEIERVISHLDLIQDLLGDLNDARIALSLLQETTGCAAGIDAYRTAQEAEIERLRAGFANAWATFDTPAWRQDLALSLTVL